MELGVRLFGQMVTEYLQAGGLLEPLAALGFNIVGYGCTTCIGNSGPLPDMVIEAINKVVRTTRQLVQEEGRDPSVDEIADKLDISEDKVKGIEGEIAVAERVVFDEAGKPANYVLLDVNPAAYQSEAMGNA